jgi:uncharacterized protein YfkK (UPF0435 family)
MNNNLKRVFLFFILAHMLLMISSCGNASSNNADDKNPKDSIQASSNEEKIKLLDKSVINLPDDELLNLINADADLSSLFYENRDVSYNEIGFEIIGKQPYSLSNKTYCFVIVGVPNPKDYHSSSGTNLIAILQLIDSKWKLINKPSELSSGGSWGNYANFDNFYIVGKSTIAIELSGGMLAQGFYGEGRSIYLIDNNQISLVFEGQKHEDDLGNGGTTNNDWDIKFIDAGTDIYDLVEEKKSEGKIISTRVLKFKKSSKKFE